LISTDLDSSADSCVGDLVLSGAVQEISIPVKISAVILLFIFSVFGMVHIVL
jgi:hypothetical protein